MAAVSTLGLYGLPFRPRTFAAKSPSSPPVGHNSTLGLFGLPFRPRTFAAKSAAQSSRVQLVSHRARQPGQPLGFV